MGKNNERSCNRWKTRAIITLKDIERRIASLVFGKSGRILEYSFVWRHINACAETILEVGCSGSSLAFQLAKKGYELHAVDMRTYPFRYQRLNFYQADARSLPFPDDSFDTVVSISTVEHIGKGQYGDPINEHGDLLAMKEMARVCKRGGRLLISTSWANEYRNIPGRERYYDDAHLNKLANGLRLEIKEYYAPLRRVWKYTFKWSKVSKEMAERAFSLGSRPIVCLLLRKI